MHKFKKLYGLKFIFQTGAVNALWKLDSTT